MKVAGQTGDLWITPGGRIRPGEDPTAALVREIREETGRDGLVVGTEIWVRHGTYLADGHRLQERERFFLMMTDQFEPSIAAMEPVLCATPVGRSAYRSPAIWTSRSPN
jgi:8-oxo-dGTP pyrophosphatase MutT (NUDIX family)